MRTLTKEAERTLIAAIEKAAELVNSGMSPNDAIIKSAGDANVPAGHINLMVHAYNTGRTTKQRENGESTLEKAADFRMADATKILSVLYPEQVKTSAELKRAETISTEYAVPPSGFLNRRRDGMQKAAAAAVALPGKTWTPPPRDEHAAAMRAQSEKNAALRAEEETRRQAAAAWHKAAAGLDELNTYFRTPGHMSFGDAVREVGLRLGPSGVSVLHKIAAVYPHFTKQAATGKNHYGDDTLYGLVQNVLQTVEDYNEAQSRVATKKADAGFSKKEAPEFITGSILHNPAEEPLELKEAAWPKNTPPAWPMPQSPSAPAKSSEKSKPIEFKPNASFFTTPTKMVGEAMGASSIADMTGGSPIDPKKEVRKQYDKLSDPDHESTLKSIKAKGVLNDLILNDPVVSGYDPQDVAMAFNEISELSPTLIDSPGMLRSVLRKRLEAGSLADFDVKQLLDMDKVRSERDKLQNETRRIGLDLM